LKIDHVTLYRLKVPLKKSYKIATATMNHFDFTLVFLEADGRAGLGEAMAGVKGYLIFLGRPSLKLKKYFFPIAKIIHVL